MGERGVSVLVGFILLMMILMLLLSVIQSVGVPKICEKYEAKAMNSYLEAFSKLSSELAGGESATLTLESVYYPNYLFLLTPSPSSFNLVTKNETISISFQAVLPNGSVQSFELQVPSKLIVLTPGFYYYPSNELIFENTAVFRKVNSKMIVVSQQKMVGAGVTVVGITGKDISISSSSPQSFYFSLLSSGSVDVKNVTLTFDSVNPDYWKEVGATVNGDKVTFKLNNTVLYFRIYGLETQKLFGVKENFGGRVLMLENSKISITKGQTVELGIKVVNDYFQPIAGVNVSVKSNVGSVSISKLKTGANGIAKVSVTAEYSGDVTFTTPYGKATYHITVTSIPLPSGSGPFSVEWVNKSELDSYYGNVWNASKDVEKTLKVSVNYNGEPVNGVNVNFVSTNTSVVYVPTQNTTVNGYAEVNAVAENNGSTTLIAYVAGSYDTLNLSVIGVSWWNSNWKYRIPIIIHSEYNLNNYQILIKLGSNFDWKNVSTNGADIRFVENNMPLPYYIEKWNYGSEALIWVNVTKIKRGKTTIYMYFGNPNASSESNPYKVFNFYDNFSTNPLNRWIVFKHENYRSEFYWNKNNKDLYLTKNYFSLGCCAFMKYKGSLRDGFAISFDFKIGGSLWTSGADGLAFFFYKDIAPYEKYGRCSDGGSLALAAFNLKNHKEVQAMGYDVEFDCYDNGKYDPSGDHIAITETFSGKDVAFNKHWQYYNTRSIENNRWHEVTIYFCTLTNHIVVYYDGSRVLDLKGKPFSEYGYRFNGFGFSAATGGAVNNHIIRNVVLRKYIEPTPTITFGNEEKY